MRCEQIRELLSPYIDQMTDKKENMLITAHLAECKECRQELEDLEFLRDALNNLEQPQIPSEFTEDLHKRLLEERSGLFGAKNLKRPKRSGWIAATVAGLALVVGIYASSILPLGNIIASFEDKSAEEKDKPKVAIEDIIKSIKDWGIENNIDNNDIDLPEGTTADVEKPISESVDKPNNKIEEQIPVQPVQDRKVPPTSVPRFTNEYAAKVNVADVGQATSQVAQIAEANGAQYEVLPNPTSMQALSANNAKEITIKVDKGKSADILNQLNVIGKVSTPLHNQLELTKQYSHLEEQIFTTKDVIESLENKAKINDNEVKQLEELKTHLKQCEKDKNKLEKEINTVTLRLFLVEDFKP
ncbi:MAG TPA: zf-HC2 domain-containing protein [Syntrophomonadaceae bacterium]|nr:zf-HC2 domain-containing protein [Syntrophomonadaceae bacterium]